MREIYSTIGGIIFFIVIVSGVAYSFNKSSIILRKIFKYFGIALILMIFVNVAFGISPQSNVKESKPVNIEKHIYDSAKIVDVKSGTGKILGKASILYMKSGDLTMEALNDWYFNYVSPNIKNWNFAMIVYTDKPNLGVHCSSMIVTKDVGIEKDTHAETWAMTGGPNGEYMGEQYIEDNNNPGHLKKFE